MLNERRNTTLRKHWDQAEEKDSATPKKYQKVAVLIIRWDDSLDTNLEAAGEV